MPPRPAGHPQQADLLYNAGPDTPLVTQAAIAFDVECAESWPLDQLNAALAHCYGFSIDDPAVGVPQIYPVLDGGRTVGFIVRPRNDTLTDEDLWDAFWGMLAAGGHADPDALTFAEPPPFFCPGGWDGVEVGIVAYPIPYGPPFPAEPVNEALWRLTRQANWPLADMQPALAPVRRGTDALTFGLWVAEGAEIAALINDPEGDDVAFRAIAALNNHKRTRGVTSGFGIRRYDLS